MDDINNQIQQDLYKKILLDVFIGFFVWNITNIAWLLIVTNDPILKWLLILWDRFMFPLVLFILFFRYSSQINPINMQARKMWLSKVWISIVFLFIFILSVFASYKETNKRWPDCQFDSGFMRRFENKLTKKIFYNETNDQCSSSKK